MQAVYVPLLSEDPSVTHALFGLMDVHKYKLIDFSAFLVRSAIASGGSCMVYNGVYKGMLVAIKAFTPPELNRTELSMFSNEVKLLSELNHPCLVRFHGLSVSPPAICLLFELCPFG